MERPIIQFFNVFKAFGANPVLRGVSLRIYQGQVTTIIGKSGGGKSVLLKHIIGLLQPDEGEILLYGQPLSKMKSSQINRLRAKFSYVFQDTALFDALTGMATPVQGVRKFQEELTRLQRHQIGFSVVMLTIENLAEINTKEGHVAGQTILKNFAAQIRQRLDITDSCSRYSLDRILVVLHTADIEDARRFATRLERELQLDDLLAIDNSNNLRIRISAGYAQAEPDSLIKEVLAKAESKDSLYYEFVLDYRENNVL